MAEFRAAFACARVEPAPPGQRLFNEGDRDDSTIYVLSGGVRLECRLLETAIIRGGTEAARCPLAAQSPRQVTAIVTEQAVLLRLPSSRIGDLLEGAGFENVAAAQTTGERMPGFAPLSDEAIALLEPEVVLLVAHGHSETLRDSFLERMRTEPAWKRASRCGSGGNSKSGGFLVRKRALGHCMPLRISDLLRPACLRKFTVDNSPAIIKAGLIMT